MRVFGDFFDPIFRPGSLAYLPPGIGDPISNYLTIIMDVSLDKYHISFNDAKLIKEKIYSGGKYQDKDTLIIIYPLSNGKVLLSEVPGRKNFILNSISELNHFKQLIKPSTDISSVNVYIRMHNYSFNLTNDSEYSKGAVKAELINRLRLKTNTNLFDLDIPIKTRLKELKNHREVSDLLFLVGVYIGEYLRTEQNYYWKLKLKHGVPQYYIPQLFKKERKLDLWPIIFRDITNCKLRPIHLILKKLKFK